MVAQRGQGLAGPAGRYPKRRKGRKGGPSSGPRRGASSPLTRSARSRRFRSASMSCAGTSRRWSASSRTPTLPRVSRPSFSMRQGIIRNYAKRSPAPRTTGSASKSCVRSSSDSRGPPSKPAVRSLIPIPRITTALLSRQWRELRRHAQSERKHADNLYLRSRAPGYGDELTVCDAAEKLPVRRAGSTPISAKLD